ncbi:MAG: polyprenol monophosphomannose synthase [Coxiellaceae bacterium]|nr:polyprenol monophosphomannose synthase [Coxiellaceae bacterium]
MEQSSKKTLIVLPTYNERENLPFLVEGIRANIGLNQDILIIDDSSPDGTGEAAKALAENNQHIHVAIRPQKSGLGTAHIYGIQYAVEHHYDYVLTMDSDCSHDPSHLPSIIKGMETHDIVIGSRYVPGGKIENWPFWRRLLSKFANGMIKLFLGLSVKDSTSGYRCYRTEIFKQFAFEDIFSTGYCFLTEIIYRFVYQGASVLESPITFCDRKFGKSKISKAELLMSQWTLVRLRFDPSIRRTLKKARALAARA